MQTRVLSSLLRNSYRPSLSISWWRISLHVIGKYVDNTTIGSKSAYLNRFSRITGSLDPNTSVTSWGASTQLISSTLVEGTRPSRPIWAEKGSSFLIKSCTILGFATNVPFPLTRCNFPSITNPIIACRTVVRLSWYICPSSLSVGM